MNQNNGKLADHLADLLQNSGLTSAFDAEQVKQLLNDGLRHVVTFAWSPEDAIRVCAMHGYSIGEDGAQLLVQASFEDDRVTEAADLLFQAVDEALWAAECERDLSVEMDLDDWMDKAEEFFLATYGSDFDFSDVRESVVEHYPGSAVVAVIEAVYAEDDPYDSTYVEEDSAYAFETPENLLAKMQEGLQDTIQAINAIALEIGEPALQVDPQLFQDQQLALLPETPAKPANSLQQAFNALGI